MRTIVFASLLSLTPVLSAGAQGPPPLTPDSLAAQPAQTASPLNYFFRSLLIPGWGQASLDRKLTGGLFLAFEGVAVGMALKAHAEMDHLERTGSERLEEKRRERQDWFVLMGMNHLFAGLEAFVSANLFDFPGDLSVRPLPAGRTGYGIRLPMPR